MLNWNQKINLRSMPWKGEKNAYKIWLSEVILQQTRVDQGLAYYLRFVADFPTISDLALADEKKVFKLWEGLGYYSRCRNLIETARIIHFKLQGIFPNTYDEIVELKGIGSYTASAIASFAFGLPYAVVDGNVYRVLSRVFGIDEAIDTKRGKKRFADLAFLLLDKEQPGTYNQAIMDFGATVCKPSAPLCSDCVFKSSCVAFDQKTVQELPIKRKRVQTKQRYFYFFDIRFQNKIALIERIEKDIWQHLYQFPLVELSRGGNTNTAIEKAKLQNWISDNCTTTNVNGTYSQKLTHQHIKAQFVKISSQMQPEGLQDYEWAHPNQLDQYGFPKIIIEYLKLAQKQC